MATPLPPSTAAPFDLRPDGPVHRTALLFHGFTGSPYEVRPLGARLAARGVHAVGPLLPGHGTTPQDLARTPGTAWTAAGQAALLDLCSRAGGPVVVGGLSAGALLSVILAAAHPERVAALVLLAPAWRLTLEGQAMIRLARLGAAHVVPIIPKRVPGGDCSDPEGRAHNPSYRATPVAALPMLGELQDAAEAAFPLVRAPVLLVHGARDETVPAWVSVRLAARLPRAARVVHHVLPQSRHLLPLDSERDELQRLVERFLEQERLLPEDLHGTP